MNQLMAVMLMLTVILSTAVLLRLVGLLDFIVRRELATTEAAPSGAAPVGLPAPADGVRIALNVQNGTQPSYDSKHSLSIFVRIIADVGPSASLSRTIGDSQGVANDRPLPATTPSG